MNVARIEIEVETKSINHFSHLAQRQVRMRGLRGPVECTDIDTDTSKDTATTTPKDTCMILL